MDIDHLHILNPWQDIRGNPNRFIPYGWQQNSQHILLGNFGSVRDYLRICGLKTSAVSDGVIDYCVVWPEVHRLISKIVTVGRSSLPGLPLITLHLLHGWEETTTPDRWRSDPEKSIEPLTMTAMYSYLENGHEIDVVTGYPAILRIDQAHTSAIYPRTRAALDFRQEMKIDPKQKIVW